MSKKKVVEKIPRLAVNLQISTTNFYEINVTSTQPPTPHTQQQPKKKKRKRDSLVESRGKTHNFSHSLNEKSNNIY